MAKLSVKSRIKDDDDSEQSKPFVEYPFEILPDRLGPAFIDSQGRQRIFAYSTALTSFIISHKYILNALASFLNWTYKKDFDAVEGDKFNALETAEWLHTYYTAFVVMYFDEAIDEIGAFYAKHYPHDGISNKKLENAMMWKLISLHEEGRLRGKSKDYTEKYLGKDTPEKPLQFLQRVYADQIKVNAVSLHEIREYDPSLYHGLMRCQRNGEIDLSQLLKKPGPPRGRKPTQSPIPEHLLDPADPRDAALLRVSEIRANNLRRKQKQRSRLKL